MAHNFHILGKGGKFTISSSNRVDGKICRDRELGCETVYSIPCLCENCHFTDMYGSYILVNEVEESIDQVQLNQCK